MIDHMDRTKEHEFLINVDLSDFEGQWKPCPTQRS